VFNCSWFQDLYPLALDILTQHSHDLTSKLYFFMKCGFSLDILLSCFKKKFSVLCWVWKCYCWWSLVFFFLKLLYWIIICENCEFGENCDKLGICEIVGYLWKLLIWFFLDGCLGWMMGERFLVRMLIPSQEVPCKDAWELRPWWVRGSLKGCSFLLKRFLVRMLEKQRWLGRGGGYR
jgi:hypothetical protein